MELLKSIVGFVMVVFVFRYIYRDGWRALMGRTVRPEPLTRYTQERILRGLSK